MPSIFSRFKSKDSKKKKGQQLDDTAPVKEVWDDAWTRKTVDPEEVQELIKLCTDELKARGMTSIPASAALRPSWVLGNQAALLTSAMQLSIFPSCSSPSARPPTPAPSGPLYGTSSMAEMARQPSAERHWPTSSG